MTRTLSPASKVYGILLRDAPLKTMCKLVLQIRDGSRYGPLLGKFCGSFVPNPVTSRTNVVSINFVTDYGFSVTGFALQWQAVNSTTPAYTPAPARTTTAVRREGVLAQRQIVSPLSDLHSATLS